jgi:hypothetical protein
MSKELNAGAHKWWQMRRPVEWSLQQHLEHPTITTTTPAEHRLLRRLRLVFDLSGTSKKAAVV